MKENYVIGVDFGTDSVRSVIIDVSNGKELSSSVFYYKRWKEGFYCDPGKNQFRQHPQDYIEGIEGSIKEALGKAPAGTADLIKGLSVDTTGSTPCAVNEKGIPLAMTDEFRDDPDGMFILWKDHTAIPEAEQINHVARNWGGTDYTKYIGYVYSSEWFWAKILHVLRNNQKLGAAAYSWVEHCDWISALLTGNTDPLTLKRSRCAAGHKAMWHESFGGLPPEEFLVKIDPLLGGLRERLFLHTFTSDEKMGIISPEWAEKLGLPGDVVIGVGAFDAHMGAVGGGIKPYTLCKIIGTSTCDILIAPSGEVGDKLIKGICGQVDGSVIPGMTGMEAGQSAFGDIYAWFTDILMWPVNLLIEQGGLHSTETDKLPGKLIEALSKEAEKIPPGESSILSLDWMNGRRTPYANQALKGAITELNLGATAPKIFRSLVEATAFGAKKIVDCFVSQGIPIKGIIALGGISKKSPFIMQVLADVLNMPIEVARSSQSCALGAAMFAAVASGIYSDIETAKEKMDNGFEVVYHPDPETVKIYQTLYEKYNNLGAFIENQTNNGGK